MTRQRWRLACIALWLCAAAPVLAADPAPPLLRPPSKVALVAASADFPPTALGSFGMDETGAIYGKFGPGSVSNYIVCWPKGTKTSEQGKILFDLEQKGQPQPVGLHWLGMTLDHGHALFARRINGSLTLGKLRCDAATQPPPLEISPTEEPLLANFVAPVAEQGRRLSSTPDGSACFPFGDVLKCFGPDKKVTRSFAIAEAVPHLAINPEWRLAMTSKLPTLGSTPTQPAESWHIDAFTFVPDGRLFALIELKIQMQVPGMPPAIVRWLVEQTAGGKIRARSLPVLQGNLCFTGASLDKSAYLPSPLLSVAELHYDAATQSILAWPVAAWDLRSNDQQATSPQDNGSPSLGIRVFPVDGNLENGYLSLTNVYAAWFSRQSRAPYLYARPGGGMLLEMGVLPKVANNSIGNGRLFDLKVDAGALDLDLDGLTAAEETALGTSPWLQDSDGGGNADRDEVNAGTKPLDPNDDAWRTQDLHRVGYSLSTLFRWRAGEVGKPPPATDPWGSQRIGGARVEPMPLCAGGTCRGRTGELVATYPVAQAWGAHPQSSDGSLLLLQDAGQYRGLLLPEGMTAPLFSVADVEQVIGQGVGAQLLYPVGRKEIYARRELGRRIAVLGDGPPRLVFDLDAVRCASGYGCSADTGFDPMRYTLDWLGYEPRYQRLLVTVRERDNVLGRSWIIGVHKTLPPVLVSNLYELAGTARQDFAHLFADCKYGGIAVPPWSTDTGRGDLLTAYGRRTASMQGLPSDLAIFPGPVRRVWGDTLVQAENASLYEVVQIAEKVEPGELLLFSYTNNVSGTEHGTLWHIPGRGGTGGVFQLPKTAISGMNVAQDGRVCLAAPIAGLFMQVQASPLSLGMPNLKRTELNVGKVVDCDYGPDGRPHLLMTDPPRVLVYKGPVDAKGKANPSDFETRPLDEAKVPFQLLVDGQGKDIVLYDAGEVIGMGKMQDGSIVEMRPEVGVEPETQRLHLHGKPVGPDLNAWINALKLHSPNQPVFQVGPPTWKSLRVHIAQRPDGLIAVLPYTPVGNVHGDAGTSPPATVLVWDPRSGQQGDLTPLIGLGMHLPSALAVIPGGSANDPWTGGPVVLSAGGGTDPGGVGGGADATGGGTKPAAKPPVDDGGCGVRSAGSTGWPSAWLVLGLAVWLGWLRRHRRRELCRGPR